jgi:preprotein translocase SecE subunit
MNKIKQYIKDSIQDFNSVTWPTKKQAIRISTIVFVFMVVGAVVLGVTDQLLADGYQMLLSLSKF